MKHYATLLDLEFANENPLKEEELLFPHLQKNLLYRMIWGYGETKEESMLDAMKNLEQQGAIETIECLGGAHTIVKKYGGRDALLHLWIHQGEYPDDDPKLFPVPGHDALVEFCNRYKLPDQAKKELAGYFTVFSQMDNQLQPVLQEDSMNTERNSYGLFDAPVRSAEKERVTLSREAIERQLEAGAFLMDREEAIAAGFINPQDEPDTVIVDVRREEV